MTSGDGGRAQPRGERVLASTRACRAQQLEQRAVAKQIEVGGVRVRCIEEALPALARSRPTMLEARHAALVEGDGPIGALAVA